MLVYENFLCLWEDILSGRFFEGDTKKKKTQKRRIAFFHPSEYDRAVWRGATFLLECFFTFLRFFEKSVCRELFGSGGRNKIRESGLK